MARVHGGQVLHVDDLLQGHLVAVVPEPVVEVHPQERRRPPHDGAVVIGAAEAIEEGAMKMCQKEIQPPSHNFFGGHMRATETILVATVSHKSRIASYQPPKKKPPVAVHWWRRKMWIASVVHVIVIGRCNRCPKGLYTLTLLTGLK